MKKILVLLMGSWLGLAPSVCAQTPSSLTSTQIYSRLERLSVLGSVLYIAAHPDDENTRLLAYLSNQRLYRTGYLSVTRGDGGQNLIGNEQGVELGLIRTQELLSARRIDGAEQFFTRAFDFGFTKSTTEALSTWNEQKILSDVVWTIRKFQPDVIITRFPEDARAGHGHHSASAVLAHEAFAAAADPSRFPEQLTHGVKPWQAKRLVWNTFNFGGLNTTSNDQLKIDVGGFNPVIGESYGEMAAESRSQHKSQGFGIPRSRGEAYEYFSAVAGVPAQVDLMDGVITSWGRVDGASKIAQQVKKLQADFSFTQPEKSLRGLIELYNQLTQLPDSYWKTQKLLETSQLIEACSGLWFEASVRTPYVAQGDRLLVTINALLRSANLDISLSQVKMDGYDTLCNQRLEFDKNYFFNADIQVARDKPISQPYWLKLPMSTGSFNVSDQSLIGTPENKPAFQVEFTIRIANQPFVFVRPVIYKYSDPVKGEQNEPLAVLPPFTGQFEPELLVFASVQQKPFTALIKKQTNKDQHPTILVSPSTGIEMQRNSDKTSNALSYSYDARPTSAGDHRAVSRLLAQEGIVDDSLLELRTISYPHIPRIDYFKPSVIDFLVTDMQVVGKKIGYIEGAGDKVPEGLRQMGLEVVMLQQQDLVADKLRDFDAIIAGVRAYDVHPWLYDKYDELMTYVRNGGNLVVQYNRNPVSAPRGSLRIGPYPFSIANIRVTDETAKVNFLMPNHPVLNYPNKITDHDFDGWIQERGIYFAGQFDSAYQAILSMNDPQEPPHNGSLIVAKYGGGSFVYTGLVFFRELPAGVPGAFRLMANIIALNHKRN